MALIVTTTKYDKDKEREKLQRRIDNTNLINYSIRIPKHIHLKLKQKLAAEDKVLKDIVMKVIMDYIEG